MVLNRNRLYAFGVFGAVMAGVLALGVLVLISFVESEPVVFEEVVPPSLQHDPIFEPPASFEPPAALPKTPFGITIERKRAPSPTGVSPDSDDDVLYDAVMYSGEGVASLTYDRIDSMAQNPLALPIFDEKIGVNRAIAMVLSQMREGERVRAWIPIRQYHWESIMRTIDRRFPRGGMPASWEWQQLSDEEYRTRLDFLSKEDGRIFWYGLDGYVVVDLHLRNVWLQNTGDL